MIQQVLLISNSLTRRVEPAGVEQRVFTTLKPGKGSKPLAGAMQVGSRPSEPLPGLTGRQSAPTASTRPNEIGGGRRPIFDVRGKIVTLDAPCKREGGHQPSGVSFLSDTKPPPMVFHETRITAFQEMMDETIRQASLAGTGEVGGINGRRNGR